MHHSHHTSGKISVCRHGFCPLLASCHGYLTCCRFPRQLRTLRIIMQREGRALPRTQRSLLDSGKWHQREEEEPASAPSVKGRRFKETPFLVLVIKCQISHQRETTHEATERFYWRSLEDNLCTKGCRSLMANQSSLCSNNDGSSSICISCS